MKVVRSFDRPYGRKQIPGTRPLKEAVHTWGGAGGLSTNFSNSQLCCEPCAHACAGCGWAQSRSSEPLPPHSPPRLPSHRNFVITSSPGLKQTQHSTTLCNLFVWSSPWRHRSWGREGGRGQTAGSMWGASSKSSFNSGTENKMPFPKASWANTTLHWWSSVTETQSRGHLGGH